MLLYFVNQTLIIPSHVPGMRASPPSTLIVRLIRPMNDTDIHDEPSNFYDFRKEGAERRCEEGVAKTADLTRRSRLAVPTCQLITRHVARRTNEYPSVTRPDSRGVDNN